MLGPRAAVLVVDGVTVCTLDPGAIVDCREGDRPARLLDVRHPGLPCHPAGQVPLGRSIGAPAPVGPTLVELRVHNLGVIDDVTVALGPGMSALTGETGAGKRVLVEAIGLLLGGRAEPSMVRAGADEAVVEGRFAGLPDCSAGGDDGVARVTTARWTARARWCWRGRWSTGAVPRRGSTAGWPRSAPSPRPPPACIELHGQHQHRSLVHTDAQRAALDAFGDVDLRALEWGPPGR